MFDEATYLGTMFEEAVYRAELVRGLCDFGLPPPLGGIVGEYAGVGLPSLSWAGDVQQPLDLQQGAGGPDSRVRCDAAASISRKRVSATLTSSRPLRPGQAVRILFDEAWRYTVKAEQWCAGGQFRRLFAGLRVQNDTSDSKSRTRISLEVDDCGGDLKWLQFEHDANGEFYLETHLVDGAIACTRILPPNPGNFYPTITISNFQFFTTVFALDILNPHARTSPFITPLSAPKHSAASGNPIVPS